MTATDTVGSGAANGYSTVVSISAKGTCSQFRRSIFLWSSISRSWFLSFLFSLVPSLSACESFICPILSFPLCFALSLGYPLAPFRSTFIASD